MINYNKKFVLVIIVILLIQGCSNFLEENNPSSVTDDFYNTKTGQEKLVVDIYTRFRDVFSTGELQYFGTDLYMAVTESPNERMFNGYDASFNSTADVVSSYWSNLYKIVQESNILLNRMSLDEDDITEDEYNTMTAEARFMRVLAYYYLVETFGPVPLYTEESDEIITEVERTSEQTIYAFMIDELTAIEGKLTMVGTEAGKISDGAVIHLLGKLYLTQAYKSFGTENDFTLAASAFDKLINDAEGSYSLLDNFEDVFDEDNQNNSEIIWAIQYGEVKEYAGSGNPQQGLFGINIVALEPELFDKVQADYSYMQRCYWVNPKAHELFTDPDIDSRYDATFQREFYVNNTSSEYYGELGIYFPKWNDKTDNDNGAINYYPFKEEGEYVWYPQSTALDVLTTGTDRMPIVKKFKDTKMDWGGIGTREDVVFRLADTYLLCAEAYLGAKQEGLALQRINTVRYRAAASASVKSSMEITSVDLDVILDERARELFGEHDRWFDLKRTGKLIERAYSYNIFVQKYNNLNENHLVRPIPQDEIDKLSGLTQNEGY